MQLAFTWSKSNTRPMCEVFLTLRHSGVFIFNFEKISHIVLMFPLLTLNK